VTEQEAIERLKRRDISGLELLVKTHQLRATQSAYLIVGDWQTAEDVVQATFLQLYERIDQFDSNRPFAPWLLRSVINLACVVGKRRKWSVPLDNQTSGQWSGQSLEELLAAPDLIDSVETRHAVWAALGQLPPAQRAVIVQRYYLDMSEDEMAQALDTPPATVKWRLYIARKRLRLLLQPLWEALKG
jgi:RNA polymerase sigma-70 factor (ECF subfamily)